MNEMRTTLSQLIEVVTRLANQGIPDERPEETDSKMPAASVGSVGREYTPEPEPGGADRFLFVDGPKITEALSKGDPEVGVQVVERLLGDDTAVMEFFILWFASHEEIRKFLMFLIVVRNLTISPERLSLLQNSLGDGALEEIRELFESQSALTQAETS